MGTPFKQAVVFVAGGGCYSEYVNLQELAERRGNGCGIAYGSTEVLAPEEFLTVLASTFAYTCSNEGMK